MQFDPLVEHRVGLTAEDFDRVAEIGEGLGEVPGVHALPAHMGLASIRQVGDRSGASGSRPAGHPSEAIGADYQSVTQRGPGARGAGNHAGPRRRGGHQEMVIVRARGRVAVDDVGRG